MLQNTKQFVIETDTSDSLPNPTTVAGREHVVNNSGAASVTITSSGPAQPFRNTPTTTVAGIVLVPGAATHVRSDGALWIVIPDGLSLGGGGCAPTLVGLDVWAQNSDINNAPLPAGGVGYRWTGTSDIDVTGFVAGTPGQCMVIHNASAAGKKIKLKSQDTASSAANRIVTHDEDINENETTVIQYDSIRNRWVRLSAHH